MNKHCTKSYRIADPGRLLLLSGSVLSSPGHHPWQSPLRITQPALCGQLAFSIGHSCGYLPGHVYLSLCQEHMRSRSGLVRGGARFAEAKMFCALIGAVSWSGPSFFSCSFARFAAADAAPGIWLFLSPPPRENREPHPPRTRRKVISLSDKKLECWDQLWGTFLISP
jgi:hypothetical protein